MRHFDAAFIMAAGLACATYTWQAEHAEFHGWALLAVSFMTTLAAIGRRNTTQRSQCTTPPKSSAN